MEADQKTHWFVWGMILATIPSIPFWLFAFRGLANQKQTGLGAVAGGGSEIFLTLGVAVTLLLPLAAIFALIRSFSKVHLGRSVFAGIAIGWSSLLFLYFGLMAWLVYRVAR